MRLAVIPARGGSKRIPRKNVRPFCGQPMIAWSIAAAREAGCMDRIIVSTDDDEIARVARACGAETPFMRPAALADDHTGTAAVVAHAIRHFQASGVQPASVCCIYATAPFLRAQDLRAGLQALESTGCDYAFSVTSYAFPIQRAIRITPGGRVEPFQPEHLLTRSQDLEAAYHDAGQFYWGRPEAWLEQRPIFSAASTPLVLPRHRVQDIDTPEDWEHAELMFRTLQQQAGRE
jgi:N-acylneuraminate cytidylyltransferase